MTEVKVERGQNDKRPRKPGVKKRKVVLRGRSLQDVDPSVTV